jgi:hypothetical protein
MSVGKDYWASLKPPLCPSDEDVEIVRCHMLEGETLLLGCTRNLIPLSDAQMDLDPWYSAPTVIKQDWPTNTKYYTNILADGSLNFTKELCDSTLTMCSNYSKVFIARAFNRKMDIMRVAAYFPQPGDFFIAPAKSIVFEHYTYYIWQFH